MLDGKITAGKIAKGTRKRVESLRARGITPTLYTIRIGEDSSSVAYERGLNKRCKDVGILFQPHVFKEEEVEQAMESLKEGASSPEVGGILLLEPVPKSVDLERLKALIPPEKDVDCVTLENQGRIYRGDFTGHCPSTPLAVMRILEDYGIPLEGKDVLIINRTTVVGRPLAMMLLGKNATVTLAHSKTADLKEKAKKADILCTAMGRSRMVDNTWVSPGQTLVDIAIAFDEEGKMTGDLDEEKVSPVVSQYTPVPGGVGSVTNAVLLEQVLNYYK